MKKILSKALAGTLLGMACCAADVEFRYTLLVNETVLNGSMIVFGRATGATEGIDDFDISAIPTFDGGGVAPAPVDDFYFRAQASMDGNNNAYNQYAYLYTDIRDASKNSTTWTLCTNGNDVKISWEGKYVNASGTTINSALPSGSGTLALYDKNDNLLVADMRSVNTITLAGNSIYNIKYVGSGATAAPATPEEICKTITIYDEAKVSVKLLDPAVYSLVEWTLCFYNGAEKLVGKDIKSGTGSTVAAYDAETGIFTYTHPADFDGTFTEFRVEYTFKYADKTRADDDGIATGMLRAVRSIEPFMELHEDCKELTIDAKATDSENTCAVSYFFKVDGDYQKTMTENLVLVGEITLPTWTYKAGSVESCPWTYSIDAKGKDFVAGTDYQVVDTADGDKRTTKLVFNAAHPLMTVTPDEALDDFVVSLVLTGNENCKSGTVAFSGSFVDVDGDTITLPKEDEAADALTATIKVKGVANLDVDGESGFDYPDIRLITNYKAGGSATTARGDRTMLLGTSFANLPDDVKKQKADEFRAKIAEMVGN